MVELRRVQRKRRITHLWVWILIGGFHFSAGSGQTGPGADSLFCTHKVALDNANKIVPWFTPRERAYDHFLHLHWNFIKTRVPNAPGPAPRSGYPQYYFYCAFVPNKGVLEPDPWMNDIGEKIPNWFANARGKTIKGITINGEEVPVSIKQVKGSEYAFVTVEPGRNHEVTLAYTP